MSGTAVAYIRVIPSDQDFTEDAQRGAIERWAAKARVEVVEWRVEQAGTGEGLDERPALQEALAAVVRLGARTLVIARRECLAAQVVAQMFVESLFAQRHTRVHVLFPPGSQRPRGTL